MRRLLTIFLLILSLSFLGCPGKNNPTSPSQPTRTATATITTQATSTATSTQTTAPTGTSTSTSTSTESPVPTDTSTLTSTRTATPSFTPTPSPTLTDSPTPSWTATASSTETATETSTRTSTPTSTATQTATSTRTSTLTDTSTSTTTATPSPTSTDTATETASQTSTDSSTSSPTSTETATDSPTTTPTDTPEFSPTSTPTLTETGTLTQTPTSTQTSSPTQTETATATVCDIYAFGNNHAGDYGNYWSWTLCVTSHTISTGTMVTGLSFNLHEDGGPTHAAIYADNGGQPSTLIAETAVSDGFYGWNTFALPPTFLQPGTYWLVVHSSYGAGVGERYNGSANSFVNWDGYDPSQPFPTDPGNWNDYSGNTFSIHAVGCEFVPTSTETPDPSWTWTATRTATPTSTDTPSHTPTATPTSTKTPTATPVDCVGSPLNAGNLFANNSGGGTMSIYRRVALPYNGWAKQLRLAGWTGTNCNVQGALYSDNGSGTAPVSQLSAPVGGSLSGATTLTLDIPDTYLFAGTYWLGFALDGSSFPIDTTGGTLAVHTGTSFPAVVTVSNPFFNVPGVVDFCTTDLTPTPTETPTPTITRTFTNTSTPTITRTETSTLTSTRTPTPSPTLTDTSTATLTLTLTSTSTSTETPTVTDTPTETSTETPTFTLTSSPTITLTPTVTLTPCAVPLLYGVGTYNQSEPSDLTTMVGSPIQIASAGNVIRLRIHTLDAPAGNVKMAIFSALPGNPGNPDQLLAMSNWSPVTATGWNEVEITDVPVPGFSLWYWIVFLQQGSNHYLGYQTSGVPIQKSWYSRTDIPTTLPPADATFGFRNYLLQAEVCP